MIFLMQKELKVSILLRNSNENMTLPPLSFSWKYL